MKKCCKYCVNWKLNNIKANNKTHEKYAENCKEFKVSPSRYFAYNNYLIFNNNHNFNKSK